MLGAAAQQAGLSDALAVVAMGKLGARELNYGSDIDIVLVGGGDPLGMLAMVRPAWRTDVALRPEGRAGPLVRSLASYIAYWDRWAKTWEFQALIKARPAAANAELGVAFSEEAAKRVWGRPLGADELRSLRAMKARSEQAVARQGLAQREIKLGRGGIRDIEFAVQLLQLVHGWEDQSLRVPATLAALGALSAGGYVARVDAKGLADAYRFFRAIEHRLQLFEDRQVHALPASGGTCSTWRASSGTGMSPAQRPSLVSSPTWPAIRRPPARSMNACTSGRCWKCLLPDRTVPVRPVRAARLASPQHRQPQPPPGVPRVRSGPRESRDEAARPKPRRCRCGRHKPAVLSESAIGERLAAFGFSDARRTRDAVVELTQGFSRTSRLMQAMVPLLLDWLSESPDPDLGLLGLRRLATGPHRRSQLTALFRESPEAARRLCLLLGTSPLFAGGYERHPEQLALLEGGPPAPPARSELVRRAIENIAWRPRYDWRRGLASLQRGEVLRAQASDVLGLADLTETGLSLSCLAESVLDVALGALAEEASAAGGRPGAGSAGYRLFGARRTREDSDSSAGGAGVGGPVPGSSGSGRTVGGSGGPGSPVGGPERRGGTDDALEAPGRAGGGHEGPGHPGNAGGFDSSLGSGSPGGAPGGLSLRAEGIALVAMGRFGGTELAYASDLDILVVFDDTKVPAEDAESTAEALLKL